MNRLLLVDMRGKKGTRVNIYVGLIGKTKGTREKLLERIN